ncbi:cob(I)yrinic acid a,c-diamide adenosyltransferase [Vampirovibrio sp.]|uniref:cob(I)yrinic acid a,c-diamide adenosyltransferase n=1 Tax=Vampirovibrio sp. TaxID=2717857 RepID=UPI0035934113
METPFSNEDSLPASSSLSAETGRETGVSDDLYNPEFSERGYIQIYTGDGKGKTTASLGLTFRALGRGWNVLLVLFTKGGTDYGELFSARQLSPQLSKQLTIVQAGLDRIIFSHNMKPEDAQEITNGWEIVKRAAFSGKYQMIVMDEVNIAIDLGLIPLQEMKDLLGEKPPALELVLTGRRAHPEIVEMAHLVSEIRPIKHYWDLGIKARKGIEY